VTLKSFLKDALLANGWYVKRARNMPTGVNWAQDLKRLLKSAPGGVMLDVGANVGQTTLFMRKEFPASVIHAFEPVPDTFAVLQQKARDLDGVFLHENAVGASEGTVEVSYLPKADARNSLITNRFAADPSARRARVAVTTIDAFCAANKIEQVCVLKTDTEGFDEQVLRGAEAMFSRNAVSAVVSEATFDPRNQLQTQFRALEGFLSSHDFLLCALYETEMLQRLDYNYGTFCNALFVRRDVLPDTT
jgi:FkbM family methyltransferase